MKALIVGASGQTGHQLVSILGEDEVIRASHTWKQGWTHLSLGDLAANPEPAKRILEAEDIGSVYCVGAAADVERCESEPQWADAVNHTGPAVLASLCKQIPFVYFSTEYVFDGAEGPYLEDARTNPICRYGASKALGEQVVLRAHPAPLILRTTVVYGQDPGAKNFLYSLRRNLLDGKEMRVPNDQVSTPTYNRDLAIAATKLVDAGHSGIFHVCGPELLSRYDAAVRCAGIMGLNSNLIKGVPTSALNQRARRPLKAGLLTERLREALPDFRMRDLEDGVKDWVWSVER